MQVSSFSSERRGLQEEKAQQPGTNWDPWGQQEQQEVENSNIFNKTPQPCTSIYNQWIYNVIASSTYDAEQMMNDKAEMIWTELDSHANMVIIGNHFHILAKTGRHVVVNPFMPQ